MKIILVANLAGGSGKSTVVQSLATAMVEYGKKVIAIDADPNAFLTYLSGVENPRFTTQELFNQQVGLDALVKTEDRYSLIPGATRLGNWEIKDLSFLISLFADYEMVLIDSPTGPSQILSALISISDLIVAPTSRDLHSIRGVLNLRDFLIAQTGEAPIKILDIVRSDWNSELHDLLSAEFEILEPGITYSNEVRDCQSSGRSLLSEFPKSQVASDFREIAYTLLEEFGLV